ncbi:MAG: succinylglutamate desuccinylase/aspartoacylase family protein, partial [Gemmatimonadota bacterium]|nr:succinylglutamate desuccinylase/aspartoacylase family protein [Gemmatimonadota bacterium]
MNSFSHLRGYVKHIASIHVLVAALVGISSYGSAQPAALRIGDAIARSGAAVSGFIDIPAGADSGTRIPVSIIRGSSAGPTLALIAGTHGSEVAPIIALQRVRQSLDPAQLKGTLILVHVAN